MRSLPRLARPAAAAIAVALALWVLASTPAWLSDPTDPATIFGPPDAAYLLFAVVGFVLLGTLYHVVPFIVWVRQYSDRVGLERVPMIDDLYDDRLAAVDFWLTLGGLALVGLAGVIDAQNAGIVGGIAATVGFVLFSANLVGVVVRHGPELLQVNSFAQAERDPDTD